MFFSEALCNPSEFRLDEKQDRKELLSMIKG